MKLDTSNLVWTRPPKSFALTPDTVTITAEKASAAGTIIAVDPDGVTVEMK